MKSSLRSIWFHTCVHCRMSSTVASEIFPHYSLIFRRSNSIYPEVPWTYSRDICHKAWEVNNKHFITYSTPCHQKYQFYYRLLSVAAGLFRSARAFCLKEWERCANSPICAWRLKVFSARFLRRYSESPSREYKDRWPKPQRKTSNANNHQLAYGTFKNNCSNMLRYGMFQDPI